MIGSSQGSVSRDAMIGGRPSAHCQASSLIVMSNEHNARQKKSGPSQASGCIVYHPAHRCSRDDPLSPLLSAGPHFTGPLSRACASRPSLLGHGEPEAAVVAPPAVPPRVGPSPVPPGDPNPSRPNRLDPPDDRRVLHPRHVEGLKNLVRRRGRHAGEQPAGGLCVAQHELFRCRQPRLIGDPVGQNRQLAWLPPGAIPASAYVRAAARTGTVLSDFAPTGSKSFFPLFTTPCFCSPCEGTTVSYPTPKGPFGAKSDRTRWTPWASRAVPHPRALSPHSPCRSPCLWVVHVWSLREGTRRPMAMGPQTLP